MVYYRPTGVGDCADDRIQFITLAGGDLSYAPLQTSRAAFCELLACTSILSFSLFSPPLLPLHESDTDLYSPFTFCDLALGTWVSHRPGGQLMNR